MPTAYDPISLAGIALTSRFVRSATAERIAMESPGDGERVGRLYAALARGGVGLIVSGHIAVQPSGKVNPLMAGLFTEAQAAEWRIAVARAHEAGGRVFAQLNHAGGRSRPAGGATTVCVSALPDRHQDPMTGEVLTDASIALLLRAFVEVAQRAKAAGFDGIQLHAAHGYLVSQFLSPQTNRRTDAWGGSLEGRSRFLLSVYRAVREAVGPDFPLGLKLGACDDDPLGLMIEETLALAKMLEKNGLDFVEVSGAFRSDIAKRKVRPGRNEGYYLEMAARFKQALAIPVVAVGGLRSLPVINAAIAKGQCDAVAMSRPLLRQPDLPRRLARGEPGDCIGCCRCLLVNDRPTACHATAGVDAESA